MPNIEYVSHDNLEYFKDKVLTKISNTYMPLTGGTFTGNVSFSSSGISSGTIINLAGFTTIGATNTLIYQSKTSFLSGYATESYVDTKANNYILKAGDTLTGVISRSSGGSYTQAPSKVLIRQTKTNALDSSYNPVIGVDTQNGFWSLGSRGGDNLSLNYSTSSDISSDTGTHKTINFPSAGSEGTLALTSDITSALVGYATETWTNSQIATETSRATSQENKALYHLGAFDSQDGKIRQTGAFSKSNCTFAQLYTAGTQGSQNSVRTLVFINNAINFNVVEALCNIGYTFTTEHAWGDMPQNSFTLYYDSNYVFNGKTGNGLVVFKNPNFASASDLGDFDIQYKLLSSYPDTPIENQSILPLDTNMANKIRQGVVDGLNLFDTSNIVKTGGYWSSSGSWNSVSGMNIYGIHLKAGNYVISYTSNATFGVYTLNNNGEWVATTYGMDSTSNPKTLTLANDSYIGFAVFVSQISIYMLNEGTYPYPRSDFNQKEHINNAEATLLKNERLKSAQLFDNSKDYEAAALTFNAGNQTLFGYPGFITKFFPVTVGKTYYVNSAASMYCGNSSNKTNSGTLVLNNVYQGYFTATAPYLLITNQTANTYTTVFANLIIQEVFDDSPLVTDKTYYGNILHEVDVFSGSKIEKTILPPILEKFSTDITDSGNYHIIAYGVTQLIACGIDSGGTGGDNNRYLGYAGDVFTVFLDSNGTLYWRNNNPDTIGRRIWILVSKL